MTIKLLLVITSYYEFTQTVLYYLQIPQPQSNIGINVESCFGSPD